MLFHVTSLSGAAHWSVVQTSLRNIGSMEDIPVRLWPSRLCNYHWESGVDLIGASPNSENVARLSTLRMAQECQCGSSEQGIRFREMESIKTEKAVNPNTDSTNIGQHWSPFQWLSRRLRIHELLVKYFTWEDYLKYISKDYPDSCWTHPAHSLD